MTNRWRADDEAAHIEDAFSMIQIDESAVAIRKLSALATAQIDRETGELELLDENGVHCYTAEEALELLEVLYQERDLLYRCAQGGH